MFVAQALQVPLTQDEHGMIRVRGTRIPLQTLIYAFKQGDTVEEIAHKYPFFNLTDIYAVITTFLGHQELVELWQSRKLKRKLCARKWKLAAIPMVLVC
jgi:uncharacterized protein (DUF433 family)